MSDLFRIAQEFTSQPATIRARFGEVVSVNADHTINVLVGGTVTDAQAEAGPSSLGSAITASGGTVGTATIDGVEYTTHTYTTNGTLTVSGGVNAELEFLLVGGGGGGGAAKTATTGGGGGGGEVVLSSLQWTYDPDAGPADFLVTIGAGGTAGTIVSTNAARGGAGGDTFVDVPLTGTFVASGGAGGGAGGMSALLDGADGASGGGGATNGLSAGTGGATTATVGYGSQGGRAGSAGTAANAQAGGGGGGAGGEGGYGTGRTLTVSTGGAGGVGFLTDFDGTAAYYAAGGGGAAFASPGVGGEGGGGAGADGSSSAGAGTANTGGGGGGGYSGKSGAAGGSGVVIARYLTTIDTGVEIDEELLSNEVDEVRYLGAGRPLPGQTVLLLSDGKDLVAVDSLAQAGSTVTVRRYRDSDLAVTGSTDTAVSWGTAVANDLLGMVKTEVGEDYWTEAIFAVLPGWYQAVGAVQWENENNDVDVWVLLNNSTILARQTEMVESTQVVYQQVTTPSFYMDSGDFVRLYVRHDGGVDADIVYVSEYLPSLTLTYLGP
jgi:hypothetical protein